MPNRPVFLWACGKGRKYDIRLSDIKYAEFREGVIINGLTHLHI